MTKVIGVWPNVRNLLIRYLGDRTGLPVYSARPEDGWQVNLPCILVDRLPGPPSTEFERTYSFDIEAYAADLDELDELVTMLEVYLFTLPSESDTRAHVDDVQAVAQFAEVPYGETGIERARTTIDVTVRPQTL